MRVYEHGLLWTELKVTCTKCGCDFIFQPKDLRKRIEYNFATSQGRAYKYTLCPECRTPYIYTSPASSRYFYDYLVGTPVDPSDDQWTYDGGDEDLKIIFDEEDDTP